jgi:hypothetical protein
MDGWINECQRSPQLRASKARIENEGVCDLVSLLFIRKTETDMVS